MEVMEVMEMTGQLASLQWQGAEEVSFRSQRRAPLQSEAVYALSEARAARVWLFPRVWGMQSFPLMRILQNVGHEQQKLDVEER